MGTGGNHRTRRIRVGIVGAGFGGLGMGIRLKQAGFYDFTIFEQGDSVGGVWRANSYPGATCDVPSHLYSFSFAPGHRWTRRYAPREEILAYLNDLADEYGLRPHLRLETAVERASFDPEKGSWSVHTSDGTEHSFEALVTACGQLTNPEIPEIAGADDFGGPAFHSAEWDDEIDLTGRRVAVIGTGASAIQFVPPVAELAAQLDIYQRSAPWIVPKADRAYPAWEQRLMHRMPSRVAVARAGLVGIFEGLTYGFTGTDWLMDGVAKLANRYRASVISDPELLAKATPDYAMGCKRVLFTNEWYPTLTRDNVELLSGAVERITAGGVVGPDGVERPADAIIWGTGFRSHDFVAPMEIHGLDGDELNAVWGERPEAYLGTTVAGFPNMFVMYGPNTNHGSGSVPYTLECQYNYTIDALRRLREGARYLTVRPEAQMRWREEIARRSEPTRWIQGGCANWYVNEEGINTNNWVGGWWEFKRRTKQLDPAEYEFTQ